MSACFFYRIITLNIAKTVAMFNDITDVDYQAEFRFGIILSS